MRLIDADRLGLTDMEIIMCDGDYKEALKMLINKIEHAPTIHTQLKTGRWLFNGNTQCSECGYSPKISSGWNYCPNCGARMKEGD